MQFLLNIILEHVDIGEGFISFDQSCVNNEKYDKQLPCYRDVVIAVRVRLRTATFFGYARLCTAGCEGDARLRTVDHLRIP